MKLFSWAQELRGLKSGCHRRPRPPWVSFSGLGGEIRERWAVARAEHKVLGEEKAMWLETR